MITVFDDNSMIPVVVWGDGDIGVAVQYRKDDTGSLVSFELLNEGPIGRDLPNERGPTFLRFLFEKEESLDVLIECLRRAKEGFKGELSIESSSERSEL